MAFYLSGVDSFLGLVLLRLNKMFTVLTTSFDCVGGDSAIASGTRTGAQVGLNVFVECRYFPTGVRAECSMTPSCLISAFRVESN